MYAEHKNARATYKQIGRTSPTHCRIGKVRNRAQAGRGGVIKIEINLELLYRVAKLIFNRLNTQGR